MGTQYVKNPSGATSTGWTSFGNKNLATGGDNASKAPTLTASAPGMRVRWTPTSGDTYTYKPQVWIALNSVPASFVPMVSGMVITDNRPAPVAGAKHLLGDLGYSPPSGDTLQNYDQRLNTFGSGSSFQYPNFLPLNYASETTGQAAGTGGFLVLTLDGTRTYDFVISGVNAYSSTDATAPGGFLMTDEDAGFNVTATDNSLTFTVTHDGKNKRAVYATDIDMGSGTFSVSSESNTRSRTLSSASTVTVRLKARGDTYAFASGADSYALVTSRTLTIPTGTFQAAYVNEAEYLKVTVDGSSSIAPGNDPVASWEWSWGDGSAKSYGAQQTHTYAAAGGYPVTLTTRTSASTGRTSSVTKTITVQAAPNPANYFVAVKNLLSVTFSPSIANGTSYAWNFGDGSTDATKSPTHVYSSPGDYTVTLTVNGNLTTTQTVTVFDAYRRLGHLNDALRLEVAVPYASGVVYNRLPNPSGSQGAYGWSTPVSGSRLTSSNTVDQPDDHGVPDAKLVYHAAGSTTQQMLSKSVRVTAGQYVGGQIVSPYLEGYFRLTVDALNGSGVVLGSSATTGYQQASTSAVYTAPYLLPTGTTLARLRIEFFGNNTGSVPAVNSIMQVRNAMLSTSATSAGVTNNPYISGRQWVDVSGPAIDISTSRDELDVGTLTATVLESGYDPATSGTIRPGQGVRLRVKTEDNAGNVVWQPLFTGTLTNATVTYNNKLKASDPKSTRIVLAATDPTTPLAQKSQPNGVATLAELPALLEDIGVPYEVNGFSSQVPAATVVAYNENASVLDQVAITRDTTGSFAYVNRAGVLVAVDKEHLDSAVVGVIDETAYSDVDASYDTQAVINSVTIKWLRYVPASVDGEGNPVEASTQEIVYGPYEDAASIDEWGYQPATFTMQGVENSDTILAKANAILAANKTPQRRIKTVTVPIRYQEDLSPGKALLDLYSLVQLGYTRTGSNSPARVVSVSHSITPSRWTMTLGFTPNGAVAAPQAVPSPPATVEAASSVPASSGPLAFGARRAAGNQSIPASTVTVVNLDTDQGSSGGMTWDATNNRYVVPKAGIYMVTARVGWAANATGIRFLYIYKNGASQARFGVAGEAVNHGEGGNLMMACEVGDTIDIRVWQSGGAAVSTDAGASGVGLAVAFLGTSG